MSLDALSNGLCRMLHNGHAHDLSQGNESPISQCNSHDSNTQGGPAVGASVPLNEILDQIPLTYSPVTKQLHLSYGAPRTEKSQEDSSQKTDADNAIQIQKNSDDSDVTKCISEGDDFSVRCDSEYSTNNDYDGDVCDEISHGVSGLLEADISSISSSASNQLDENLVDNADDKPKRRGISSFFSKNVFTWKGRDNANTSPSNSGIISNGLPSWLIFGKSSSDTVSEDNHTDNESNSAIGSFNKPYLPDSPTSVRSATSSTSFGVGSQNNLKCNSTGSQKFQDVVASSTALIQHERPPTLPAKDSKEDAKHRMEYSQMIEAAKKREFREAKLKKRQQEQQIKQEDRLATATRIWTNEVLPDWDSLKNCRRIRDLWWQGLPPCVRGKVWQHAIGNELNVTHQLYGICVSRAQELLRAVSSSSSCDSLSEHDNPDRESSVELIQLDISRTFPQLCIFQKGGPYYDILHSLLGAYACYRPDVGYVQGMSFIAAVLILNMEEADAFVCFANLLNRPCHMAFFRLEQVAMRTYYWMFNQFFQENLPRLHAHFVSVNLTPDLYLLDWIYTVFAKAMPLDVACRVWDVFLRDGEEFLFRTALGVLHLHQNELITLDFIQGAQFLTRLPEDLSSDKLFRSIETIRMPRYAEVLVASRASVSVSALESA